MRGIILIVIIAAGAATAAQKLITSDFNPALTSGAVGGAVGALLMSRRRGSGK